MLRLRALTLVQGDTSEAVRWPASLDQYTAQLKKLANLNFFAFDREAPQPDPRPNPPVKQMVLEYKALSEIGVACPKLAEAVAVYEDVSEGEQRISPAAQVSDCGGADVAWLAGACRLARVLCNVRAAAGQG